MSDAARYIEVYDNLTEELLYSYEITLPDEEAIIHIRPDSDDEEAVFAYELNKNQVIDLGGKELLYLYKDKDVSFYAACYQK